MWQRFTLYDLRVIGHYLGTLLLFFAALMALPLATALVFQEWEPAARYLAAIGITMVAGCSLRFLRIEPGRLDRRQALAVTGFAWVVLALFASFPLYLSGHYMTYLDAIFDGVSGLTTTGASLIVDLDHLSYADNMFRFAMHALGGLGLIVVALSFGLFGRGGGASLFSSEGRSEHVVPNVVQTTQFIARITLVIVSVATVIITALCLLMGMEPTRAFLNALWVSTSGFVTGGFTPMQLSIMYYHSFPLEAILMVLMILGSISFVIHAEVWKGRPLPFFRDIETKTMVLWIGVMAFVFTATLALSPFDDMLALLRRGLFMIISAFTTTGFQVVTTNQITTAFSNGAFLTLAFIMAVGGASGSTAGGIKFSRMGIIFKSIVSNVKESAGTGFGSRRRFLQSRGQAHLDAGNCERGHDGVHPVRDHLRYRRAGGHCARVRGHSRNLRVGGHDVQRRHHHVGGGARHGGNPRAVLHLPDVGWPLGVHDAVRPYCGSGGLPGAAASTEGALMRRRGIALLAIALAAVLAAPGPVAWATGAANGDAAASSDGGVTNEDVPTDDTGVVEAGEDAGNEGAGSEGADGGAVQGGGAEGEGASGGATEGENGADGEDGQAVDKPARPKLPDPVFGEDVNEDNLVNPQQKPDSSFIYDTSISALQGADST